MSVYQYIYDFIIGELKLLNNALGSHSILNLEFTAGVPIYDFIAQILTIGFIWFMLYLIFCLFRKLLRPVFKVGVK